MAAANPTRAAAIKAYVRSTMPCYGINMPALRAITRGVFAIAPMTCDGWRDMILQRDRDLALLYANIEPNLTDRGFFIRKAIGWALRQYAWTDPGEVARYVRANDSRPSGLSKREAMKNI